jgi:hypothetical protein
MSVNKFTVSVNNIRSLLETTQKCACNMTRDDYARLMGMIDEKLGRINLYEMLPNEGDTLVVQNCGDHFEIRHHHWSHPPLLLTDTDIELLRQGNMVWN